MKLDENCHYCDILFSKDDTLLVYEREIIVEYLFSIDLWHKKQGNTS
jgi:hypothetical protein